MDFQSFLNFVLNDIKVELTDEFDKNFQRKAFFDQPWPQTKFPNPKGSLMMRSGDLRNSIKADIEGDGVRFSSSEPYANIQNEGGILTVTAAMKRFFWAKYYEASGGITKTKKGSVSASKKNVQLSNIAQYWKNMALIKVGTKITIPSRRFIGDHPQVDAAIKSVIDDNVSELNKEIYNMLKPK